MTDFLVNLLVAMGAMAVCRIWFEGTPAEGFIVYMVVFVGGLMYLEDNQRGKDD